MLWQKDVEARSKLVWGSLEAVEKEKRRRMRQRENNLNSIMTRLIRRRRERERQSSDKDESFKDHHRTPPKRGKSSDGHGLKGDSGKVVLTAIGINFANCAAKMVAWLLSGELACE